MKQTREAFWKPALPQRARWVRQASGVGWVRRGEQCRESGLACDRGWRGIAPSVAVFQCSFSLGTSVMEVNVVFYVMCKCLQNRECVCVCGGKENREKKKKKKKSVRAVNTSKVTSFGWASLHGSAQLELLRDQSPQRHPHLWECVCVCENEFTCLSLCARCICVICMCVGGGFC